MPLSTTRYETGKLMNGQAEGVTRMYLSGCPHKPGDEVILSSKFLDGSGEDKGYAAATIKSVRPCTVDERKRDDRLAKLDGFPNGPSWYGHFERMYGEQRPDAMTYRLQLRIEEMEKK